MPTYLPGHERVHEEFNFTVTLHPFQLGGLHSLALNKLTGQTRAINTHTHTQITLLNIEPKVQMRSR